MRIADSWTLALETLAALPLIWGFVPTESMVVATFDVGDGSGPGKLLLNLGPAARLDLADAEAMAAGRDGENLQRITGPLRQLGHPAGLVAVWHEVEEIDDALAILDRLRGPLNGVWPFDYHYGYFLVSSGGIVGIAADGEYLGCHDPLELAVTSAAMGHAACDLPEGPDHLAVPRSPRAAGTAEVAAARDQLARAPWGRETSTALTREFQVALAYAGALDHAHRGVLAHGLTRPAIRDGFLTWVLAGAPPVEDLAEVAVGSLLGMRGGRPDGRVIAAAQALLADVARFLPEGEAAPALACGAYLAWFDGAGALARVLAGEALAEDPAHTLAQLVRDVLEQVIPPPWVEQGGAVA